MTGPGRPPVILIGMHRSGTSMLARALQALGLFIGAGTNRNAEARFTNAVDRWVLRQASSTWDFPEGIDYLLADERSRALVVEYMRALVRGPASIRFVGLASFLRGVTMASQVRPWGWKEPRTTVTLPLWLDLFPEARVVHIYRHGVDVAQSLVVRRRRALAAAAERYHRHRLLYQQSPFAPKRSGFGHAVRCATLEGAFALWEAYMERAQRNLASCGERAIEVRYEELLSEREAWLPRLARFAGLDPDEASVQRVLADLRPGRAFAYRDQDSLVAFAQRVSARLSVYGY